MIKKTVFLVTALCVMNYSLQAMQPHQLKGIKGFEPDEVYESIQTKQIPNNGKEAPGDCIPLLYYMLGAYPYAHFNWFYEQRDPTAKTPLETKFIDDESARYIDLALKLASTMYARPAGFCLKRFCDVIRKNADEILAIIEQIPDETDKSNKKKRLSAIPQNVYSFLAKYFIKRDLILTISNPEFEQLLQNATFTLADNKIIISVTDSHKDLKTKQPATPQSTSQKYSVSSLLPGFTLGSITALSILGLCYYAPTILRYFRK